MDGPRSHRVLLPQDRRETRPLAHFRGPCCVVRSRGLGLRNALTTAICIGEMQPLYLKSTPPTSNPNTRLRGRSLFVARSLGSRVPDPAAKYRRDNNNCGGVPSGMRSISKVKRCMYRYLCTDSARPAPAEIVGRTRSRSHHHRPQYSKALRADLPVASAELLGVWRFSAAPRFKSRLVSLLVVILSDADLGFADIELTGKTRSCSWKRSVDRHQQLSAIRFQVDRRNVEIIGKVAFAD